MSSVKAHCQVVIAIMKDMDRAIPVKKFETLQSTNSLWR